MSTLVRRRFATELAPMLDALLFASPSHRSRRRVADELATLTRHEQDIVLHWAQVVACTQPELAWQICARACGAFSRSAGLPIEDFSAWVKAVLAERDAGQSGALPLQQALIDDLEGFLERRADTGAIDYATLARRLSLFARAASQGLLGTQSVDDGLWTDGENINVPPRLAGHGAERRYFGLVALASAQWVSGGLTEAIEAELLGADDNADVLIDCFAELETARLAACVGREFPGLGSALPRAELPESVRARVDAIASDPAAALASARLARELVAAGCVMPRCSPLMINFAAVRACRARLECRAQPGRPRPSPSLLVQDAGRSCPKPSGQALDLSGSVDQSGSDGSVLPTGGQPHASTPPIVPPSVHEHGYSQPAGEGHWQAQSGQAEAATQDVAQGPALRYDEWDYRRQDYRKAWCHLYEHDGAPGEGDWVAATVAKHARHIRQVRRRFESLRGQECWRRHQTEGTEIDLDAVVDAIAEHRAASSGGEFDPRLFCRREPRARSLAVVFMVDMSGSTKGWVNDAEREALVMLCEAIEALGDAYAIYGFSGWTHRRCDIYRIKSFAEPCDASVKARIAGIEARDYTRMGPAIRHIAGLLAGRSERHKLLVTLSDGRPDDFGDEYRGRYGIEDTRRALQEARRQGVSSYCITVDRHAADYLPQLYGSAHYSVLADARALPLRVAQVYRRLVS